MNRSKRKGTAEQTVKILESGCYLYQGKQVQLRDLIDASIKGSFCVTPDDVIATDECPQIGETKYMIENESTFSGARALLDQGFKKLTCLNFASAKNPGGGFLNGSQAQEEALARASALYPTLLANRLYYDENRAFPNPLYTDHIIYSPQVPVFRNDADDLLSEPYLVDIITAPAVNSGAIQFDRQHLVEQIEPVMRKRIERIVKLAISQKTEALVLGAWGCGVFRNDPNLIAQWFEDCLNSPSLKGRIKTVRFSILSNDTSIQKAFERFQ